MWRLGECGDGDVRWGDVGCGDGDVRWGDVGCGDVRCVVWRWGYVEMWDVVGCGGGFEACTCRCG